MKAFIVVIDVLPKGGGFASITFGENKGNKVFIPSKTSKDIKVGENFLADVVWNNPKDFASCPYLAFKMKKLDDKLIDLSEVQIADLDKLTADLIERVKQGLTTVEDGEIIEIIMGDKYENRNICR